MRPGEFRRWFLEEAGKAPDEHLNIAANSSGVAGCRRQGWYNLTQAEPEPSRSAELRGEDRAAAKMGNLIEPWVYERLEAMGLEVKDAQTAWAIMSCRGILRQPSDDSLKAYIEGHSLKQGHATCIPIVTGHPDGILIDSNDDRGPGLLELKFMNYRRYSAIATHGVEGIEDDRQSTNRANLNMHAMGVKWCRMMDFSKDKTAVKVMHLLPFLRGRTKLGTEATFLNVEDFEIDMEAVEYGLKRGEELVNSTGGGGLRDYDPTGSRPDWQCQYCPFHKRCLRDGE